MTTLKNLFFAFTLALLCSSAALASDAIKVACVGNSITYGTGIANRDKDSYPVKLQALLGNKYEVENFGKPGATLLNHGHRPYTQQEEYQKALSFAGDIVVIHLGINDTDPRNWPNYRDEFVGDYCSLIESFRKVNPNCRIIIARLTPLAHRHYRFESGTRDWLGQIQMDIERVAKIENVQLIDFHEALYPYPQMLADGIHPDEKGAEILARTVYEGITGDFGGLQMPALYGNGMMLQHGKALTINGKANTGDKVTVTIGGKSYQASTSDRGRWAVSIDPLKAGSKYDLKVATNNKTLTYSDILAGDIWLCSGQSNMAFMLHEAATAKTDIPKATNPNIRLYDMKARWLTNNVEWDASVLDSLNNLQYYKTNGWQPCTPDNAKDFSAIGYYFAQRLQSDVNVPIGVICNAIGGSGTEAWIDRETLEYQFPAVLRDWTHNDFIQDWVRGRASKNIAKSESKLQRHPYEPCYLFESGILPLDHFAIKGVLWYQGESNAHCIESHEKLFGLLVNSWRNYWNDPELPFYFVQLSSLNRPSWPWFRDSQRRLAKNMNNVEMTVSSDLGDSLDVHPKQKLQVGERLAFLAEHNLYGKKKVTPCGPMYKSLRIEGNKAIVSFDYAKGLRAANGSKLLTFEIADDNGVFHPAAATISGDKVIVQSPAVAHPSAVRYGWQPFTRANLVNGAGLPASTFRTDVE